MSEFKFEIGEMVVLRGTSVSGVVSERFTNADRQLAYYSVASGFSGQSPLIEERLLETVADANARQAEEERQANEEFEARRAKRRTADA